MRPGRTRSRLSLGVVPLLFVLAAGCGAENGGEPAIEVSEEERVGGLAVVCSEAALESLNPFVSPDLGAADMRLLLFTPLMLYDSVGDYRPYLAEEWSWSEDRRTLRLRIRDDVSWHDGRRTTAEDVAWTIRAAAKPGYAYAGGPEFAALEEATALDSVTLELRFGEPQAGVLEALVQLPTLPAHLLRDVPPEEFARADYHRAPVGNGPFRFVERRTDGSIVFERYPDFPSGLGTPYLDRIIFRAIPEPTTIVAELRTGGVDLCVTGSGLAARLEGMSGIEMQSAAPVGVQTIFLNLDHPPLDDERVRRALSAALRRAEIAAVASPIAGPAGNPMPPNSPWIDTTVVQPDADSALAARLLSSAGWMRSDGQGVRRNAAGAPLELTLMAPPNLEPTMTVVQAQLGRLGVSVELRFMEFSSYIPTILNPSTRPDAMALGLYEVKVRRPGFYSVLHSEGDQNLSSYSDPRVDSALARLDDVGSAGLEPVYDEIQRQVADDVPMIYTIYVPRLLAVGPRVRAVRADLNGPFGTVLEWWVPPERRRRTS